MTETATDSKRVRVEPLSARHELLALIRVGMAIVVGVWIYVAAAAGTGGAPAERHLLPFQKLIADRGQEEQRTFRELQEALLEAEAARSSTGAWPTPVALATNGVPPFTPDPTKRSVYEWRLVQSGTIVNYLGLPKNPSESAWLLLVQEPVPGVPPDQTFEDEEHHRLASGAMLHVSTWVHTDGGTVRTEIIRMPQAEGWVQLYAVGPSATPPSGAVTR